MKINLVRIDDRLIHGQVATVWSKEANAQRIIICSDEVAKDQIRKTLLLQVGPPGVKVSVVDVAKAVRVYNNPKYEKDTVFFLYTCPQDVLRMAEAGVPIKSVNIGGMAFKTGKTQITKAVSVDESDIAAFKKLHEMGIELEIRPVATDKKVDLIFVIAPVDNQKHLFIINLLMKLISNPGACAPLLQAEDPALVFETIRNLTEK